MNAHTVVNLDLGDLEVARLLSCPHPDGRVSFRLVDSSTQVWVTGDGLAFLAFADAVEALAARVRAERTEVES